MEKNIIGSRNQAVKLIYELREKLTESNSSFEESTTDRKTVSAILSKEFESIDNTESKYLSFNRDFITMVSNSIDNLIDFIICTKDKELADYLLTCSKALELWEFVFFKYKLEYLLFEKINVSIYLLDDFFNYGNKQVGVPNNTNTVSSRLLEIFKGDENEALSFINETKGIKTAASIARKAYKTAIKGKIEINSIHRPLYRELKHLGIINVTEQAWNDAIINEEARQKKSK